MPDMGRIEGVEELLSTLVSLAGWAGAAVTIGEYALVTNGRVSPSSVAYQGLNIGGAAALALSATASGAWPSAVTNLIWIAIGIQAVLSLKHVPVRLIAVRAVLRVLRVLSVLAEPFAASPATGPSHTAAPAPVPVPSPARVPVAVGALPAPLR